MKVRFDDAIPKLAQVVFDELGKEVLDNGVALRDAAGRLAFFASVDVSELARERVSEKLREALDVYGRSDRIFAAANDYGVETALKDPAILNVVIGKHKIRLLDRRLVGADWLRKPVAVSTFPPRFVFASIKGGVGRSTALAVSAAELAAKGLRVLVIDMDMEAPGLGAMLLAEDELPEFGLIDALVENGLTPLDLEFYADLIAPSSLAGNRGRIDVIPAFGKRSTQRPAEVLAKLSRAYLEDVNSDGQIFSISEQLAAIVDHFSGTGLYDAILIDSRAGLHETTAAALLGLGAELFLFGLNERQTFLGYSVLFSHLSLFKASLVVQPEWVERITMVQGRAPVDPKLREDFASKCQVLFEQCGLVEAPSQEEIVVQIPAEPFDNIPWDDDSEFLLEEPLGPGPTIAILDDERFKLFDPRSRGDLLSEEVYRSSYESLLNVINEVVVEARKAVPNA